LASRPAWSMENGYVRCKQFEFVWNGGFALVQKQKNVKALHETIMAVEGERALEVSTKGMEPLGKQIGAFSLKLGGVPLENVFQAAKKYEKGGPYSDLLSVSPKEAKTDERHHSSGKLIGFERDEEIWSLEPKTLFYDYIYITALIENYGYQLDLEKYQWFTDIEFNPQKSINCQARSAAIYKLLQQKDLFRVLRNREEWCAFHKEYVRN